MASFFLNKNVDLDKICRVCLIQRKDMKSLFEEKLLVSMLMEVAQVEIENTDGWPDKICVQCVHQVSRCHAFKNRVEKSDDELRSYVKSLTVVVEPPPQVADVPKATRQKHQQTQQQNFTTNAPTATEQGIQTIQPQVILPNGQIHNPQILNTQIINPHSSHQSQQITQILNASQLEQLIQTGNTVQMLQQNGQPTQVVFQRAGDNRCEIIVQSDMEDDAQYFEDEIIENTEDVNIIESIEADDEEEIEETTQMSTEELHFVEELEEFEPEQNEEEEEIEDEEEELHQVLEQKFDATIEDEPDKEFVAEFISSQTTCLGPGRFVCNLCRKEFSKLKWLQNHMKSHSNWIKANCKKQPECEICHRSFKGPGMLRMHMKTHEQKSYQCGNCLKLFSSPYTLNSHMTNKHVTEHCKFKCVQCDEIFYNLDLIKAHMQNTGHSKNIQAEDSS